MDGEIDNDRDLMQGSFRCNLPLGVIIATNPLYLSVDLSDIRCNPERGGI